MTTINKFTNNDMPKRTIVINMLIGIFLLSSCALTEKNKLVVPKQTNTPEKTQEETPSQEVVKKVVKKAVPDKLTAPKKTKVKRLAPKTTTKHASKNKPKVEKKIPQVENKTLQVEKKTPQDSEIKNSLSMPDLSLTSLDQIPLELSNGWMLTIDNLPLSTSESCILYHEKNGMFDGYRDNNIKAYLTLSQLVIKSDSNFDLTYPETGIYIESDDESTLINSLTLSSQPNTAKSELLLINYLGSSPKNLLVKSGYWPSWPITETRTITLPFTKIDNMVTTLDACNSLLTSQ